MKLRDEMETTGAWLFKHRGIFPFAILPILIIALTESESIEAVFGTTVLTIWEVLCVLVSCSGLVLRSVTVGWVPEGTSGRNTQGQQADVLNTLGIYSITRNPLYLANFMITFGFVLFVQVWWFAIIFILFFTLFYERIIFTEEAYLENKFGETYRIWAKQTPIFFPNFSLWKNPSRTFSWKMVLKREYSTVLGIIVGFIAIKFFAELLGEGNLKFRMSWVILLAAGSVIYLVLRTIRKKTKLLTIRTP